MGDRFASTYPAPMTFRTWPNQETQAEFDIAITCAGEDRAYVEQVVTRLQDQGVRVFYDSNEQARLWGQNLLDVLVDVYRSRALRVLMFVSAAYAKKTWPNQERRAALERAMQSDEPYVLPVRLDDTQLPGLPGTAAHIDGRKKTAVEVADMTIEHLRSYGYDVPAAPAQRDMAQRVSIRAIPSQTPQGNWEAPYQIHNGGDYPIENVVIVIDDPGRDGDPLDQSGTATELVIGPVAAGATESGRIEHMHFTREPAFAELTHLATLLFSDHWGNNWAITGTRLVERKSPARTC